MLGQIILQIILIALNAMIVFSESAAVCINDSRLEKLASGGDRRALRLKKLTDKPARFSAAAGIAVKAVEFTAAAYASADFSGRITDLIDGTGCGIPKGVVRAVSVIAVALVLSYFFIVFGELVPKRAAAKDPEKAALRTSRIISFTAAVFAPFEWLLSASANGVLRLMGIDPKDTEDTVTEEEILMMSDAGAEKGTIDEDENRIIKNVFAFDDMTADQVCTHRTDVSVLWSSDDTDVWEETIHRTRHSAFPVCGDSVDNVIGILDAKDYFRLEDKSRENIMKNAVTEPYFVHENMKADRLFEQMKKPGADRFAVVVDEYGGMSGIITVTDLVEKLVGDFSDDDDDCFKLEQIGENVWNVPGIQSLSEVSEELELELPVELYDTFGGYVISVLGEIPKDGSTCTLEVGSLNIEVLHVHHHRIELCRVTKIIPQQEDQGE